MEEKSFTVIELLMVIAILGLAIVLGIVTAKQVREKARISATLQFSSSIKHAFFLDMVGEWEFEDSPEDSSGNNLQSYWVGSASYVENDASSSLGKAGQFTGSNLLEVTDPGQNSILDVSNEITLESLVKITEFGSKLWQCIVCKDQVYELRISKNGQASFRLRGENTPWYENAVDESIFKFQTGKWYHFLGTWNGLEMKIFIDGKEKGDPVNFSGILQENDRDLVIGEDFIGLLDEVRIYSNSFAKTQ